MCDRRGSVSALLVVVLLLMMGLVVQLTQRSLTDRRQMRREFLQQQAQQLAQAGVLRVRQLKAAQQDFSGDVWELPPGVLHETNSGQVTITVDGNSATVVARYPANSPLPVQVTRTIALK
ncbi:MAG: hypothetical protein R3C49_16965 [Planctomycetaceae bacterium]